MARGAADARKRLLTEAVAELRDLPHSYWHQLAKDGVAFTKPARLDTGGRCEIGVRAARHPAGSENIRVTVTLTRGWRRPLIERFVITPDNQFI